MDDLKLIERREEELINQIRIVKTISNDIKMEFGLEKVPDFLYKLARFMEINTKETSG